MSALRASIVLCALSLVACDKLLGLEDIVPDGEPVAVAFNAPLAGSVAQQPLGVIGLTVQDIQGKPVSSFSGEVKLAFGNNPGGGSLLGALTATVMGGVASFDLVGIDKPGTGYTLVASIEGLPPVTSNAIDVLAPRFTPVPTGLAGGLVASIAVSPAPPGGTPTVFAGAANGVYKSVDGGASWKPAGFGGDIAGHLIADPSQPGVVYFARFAASTSYFLKKTVDGGATWHDLTAQSAFDLSYALDPKNPSVIYVVGGNLLRRSNDGGTTWTNLTFNPSLQVYCNQIVVDAVIADTVYCGTYNPVGLSAGVYKSSDAGATWGPANTGLGSPLNVGIVVATPNGVFVNSNGMLYRSLDAGATWTSVLTSGTSALAYAPSMPKRIYVAQGGVSVSNDGGVSFGAPIGVGDFIESLTVDPMNPDVVYATGGNSGVFVSTNGGVSWSPALKGLDAHPITSVAVAPGTPGTILTTTVGDLLRTTDGGASWAASPQPNVTAHFDPAVSTRAYLCGGNYFATSTNSGASFTGGNVAGINGVCGKLLIAGTTFFIVGSGRLSKSSDSGATWTDTGLGTGLFVTDAALGDAIGNVVLASTTGGIYRSTTGGTSFTQVTTSYAYSIVADPKLPTHFSSSSECPGFLRSTDGGASFGSATGPCAAKLFTAGSALYGSSNFFNALAVETSTDGGSTWTSVDTSGVPKGVAVTSVGASDDGTMVYLGTDAGLYQGAR